MSISYRYSLSPQAGSHTLTRFFQTLLGWEREVFYLLLVIDSLPVLGESETNGFLTLFLPVTDH